MTRSGYKSTAKKTVAGGDMTRSGCRSTIKSIVAVRVESLLG